jgi:hypothetical protein
LRIRGGGLSVRGAQSLASPRATSTPRAAHFSPQQPTDDEDGNDDENENDDGGNDDDGNDDGGGGGGGVGSRQRGCEKRANAVGTRLGASGGSGEGRGGSGRSGAKRQVVVVDSDEEVAAEANAAAEGPASQGTAAESSEPIKPPGQPAAATKAGWNESTSAYNTASEDPFEYVRRRVAKNGNCGYVASYDAAEGYLVKYDDGGSEVTLQKADLDVILVNLKGATYEINRKTDKWKAQGKFGVKTRTLGYFKNEYDAAKKYDATVDEKRLNFRSV